MASILVQCPRCGRIQSVKNKWCGNKRWRPKRGGDPRPCALDLRRVKKKNYWIDFTAEEPGGRKRHRELVGPSYTEAEEKLHRRQADISRGEYCRNDVLFKRLAGFYTDSDATRALDGYPRIKSALDLHILPHFGDRFVWQITPDALNSYAQQRLKEKSYRGRLTSICTINRELAFIRQIFNFGIAERMINVYPFGKKRVKFFDERSRERSRYVSYEEYRLLYKHSPEYFKPVIETAYHTGMRTGEILNLQWDRVDLVNGFIKLRPEDTKTDTGRKVPLNADLAQTFKDLGRVRSLNHNYVFTSNGQPIKDVRQVFDGVKKDCGVQDLWFHDLRGTAATNMLDATGDQKTVMAITGHKTPSVFRRYIKVTDQRLKAAAEAAYQTIKGQ